MQGTPKKLAKQIAFKLLNGLFGGYVKFGLWEEEVTIAAAAYTDTTATFPAGCIPLGLGYRVKTLIPTAATFDLGVAGATTQYGTNIVVAAGTNGVGANLTIPAAASAVRITPNTSPAAATGRLILQGSYIQLVAPTRTKKQ